MATNKVKRANVVKTNKAQRALDKAHKVDVDVEKIEQANLARLNAPRTTNSNIPFLPAMDMERFVHSVDVAEQKDGEAKAAQSHRVYNAVLLMLNNPAHIEVWASQWDLVNGKDKALKADANAWFDQDFALSDPSKLSPDAKMRWNNKRRMLMLSVQFCVVLRRSGWMRSFEFNELGTCFLLTASTLGQKIAKWKEWTESEVFKKSGQNIVMVETKTKNEGRISWAELETQVLKKDSTGEESDVDKSDITTLRQAVSVDMAKPFKVMAQAQSELAGRDTFTKSEHQQAMERLDAIVATVFKAQAFAENVALYLVFSKAMRSQLEMPVSKLATGSGKQVSQPIKGIDPNVKVDVVTPDAVKALPLAKLPPARVVTAEELKAHRVAKALLIKQASKPAKKASKRK